MKFRLFPVVCGLALAVSANASQLFTNTGFETGSLGPWITASTAGSDDAFTVQSGVPTPLNGYPTVGPNSGTYYAVSDGTGLVASEETYLVQSIAIPVGTIDDAFSANMFVNDQGGGGSGLGGEIAIWASGANPLTDAPLFIIAGPTDTAVVNGNPNPYLSISLDITGHVVAGTTYLIGVLEGDSLAPINVGLDNFSLLATPASTSTPEPAMLFPTALLAAGLFFYRARSKARGQI